MTTLRDDQLPDGTLLLRSNLLESQGFPHAFSTAIGPEGRCFDLSRPGHSPLETPSDRLQLDIERFATEVAPGATLSSPRQVHGIEIVDACMADDTPADAACTSDPRTDRCDPNCGLRAHPPRLPEAKRGGRDSCWLARAGR